MNLNELRENPNNPSKCTEEQLERLAGKLKRVPLGLTAIRIAYVTDAEGGGKMVISGNKRLRVLKRAFGENAVLPDEYFQDVTAMSEAERHEFIVTANVSDGDWDIETLLAQYDDTELKELLDPAELAKILDEAKDGASDQTPCDDDADEPDPEVYSEEGKRYDLDSNILICTDPSSCDDIRKMFAEMKSGSQDNWQSYSPEVVEGQELQSL